MNVDKTQSALKNEKRPYRFEIELPKSPNSENYIFDFLDIVRGSTKKENNGTHQDAAEDSSNDSEVQAMARMFEEKYGHRNDYAELAEGYDDDDSFIDNTDAKNDLVPNGFETELGGFYINRGKLVLVKEDSSSSNSEYAEKFFHNTKKNSRKIASDSEDDVKVENGRTDAVAPPVKNRKRSGDFSHKSKTQKKFRKLATPKIPDHLLQKRPFSGSEFNKNMSEIKKNRLKNVDVSDGAGSTEVSPEKKQKISKEPSRRSSSEDVTATAPACAQAPDLHNIDEAIEAVATGADLIKSGAVKKDEREKRSSHETSCTSSSSSSSSSSDSDSESSSSETSEKTVPSPGPGKSPLRVPCDLSPRRSVSDAPPPSTVISALPPEVTEIIANISVTSKEEKCRKSTQRLNKLLLSLDEKIQSLTLPLKNSAMDQVSQLLDLKAGNLVKRTKKLQLTRFENRMATPMRRLKETIADMMPKLESDYFKEFTKASGTRSVDSSGIPQRKFPWDDTLRGYLHEIVTCRQNCYSIIRPRKESAADYVHAFLESKVRPLWPKEWMTIEILVREAQNASAKFNQNASAYHPRLVPSPSAGKKHVLNPRSALSIPRVRKPGPMSKATLIPRKPHSTNYMDLTRPKGAQLTESPPLLSSCSSGLIISPVKDSPRISPSVEADILNLSKNSSVSISKVPNRSVSPNITVPVLPAGTTISPASSLPPPRTDLSPNLPVANISVSKVESPKARETSVIRNDCRNPAIDISLVKNSTRELEISIAKPITSPKENDSFNNVSRQKFDVRDSQDRRMFDASKTDVVSITKECRVGSRKDNDVSKGELRNDLSGVSVIAQGKDNLPRMVVNTQVGPSTNKPKIEQVENVDRYKYVPVRKRAVQEYMGQTTLGHTANVIPPPPLPPPPGERDKGLDVFTKMLENFTTGGSNSHNEGKISVKSFGKTEATATATTTAPTHDKEQLVQLEMSRVMQNIMELSSKNSDTHQEAFTVNSIRSNQ